jgi:RNA polymerase sigma-70 factor (ECF subfamily)
MSTTYTLNVAPLALVCWIRDCKMHRADQGRLAELPDDELLRLIRTGSDHAFDELFNRHHTTAYRVAYRLLNNEADALDAVQDGFINVLRNLKQFRAQSTFRTWLLRIVSHAALDLGRSRRRREARFVDSLTDHASNGVTMQDAMNGTELRQLLEQALATMPEAQRQTFVLHLDGELSYQEIAETLALPIGTVMSRLYYARQKLKELLAPHSQL